MSKTKLFDTRKITTISLPSYPDVEIVLYGDLLTHEFEKLSEIEKDYDKGMNTIICLIKSWSFVDENENSLEVNKENLGKLPAKDFTFLMERAGQVMEDVSSKKAGSSKK